MKNVQGGLNGYLFFFELFFFLIIWKTRNTFLFNKKWPLNIKKSDAIAFLCLEKKETPEVKNSYSDYQKTME